MITVHRIKSPNGDGFSIIIDDAKDMAEFKKLVARGAQTWDGISPEMLTFVDSVTLEDNEPRQNHLNPGQQLWK